jgi:hypothetical protein
MDIELSKYSQCHYNLVIHYLGSFHIQPDVFLSSLKLQLSNNILISKWLIDQKERRNERIVCSQNVKHASSHFCFLIKISFLSFWQIWKWYACLFWLLLWWRRKGEERSRCHSQAMENLACMNSSCLCYVDSELKLPIANSLLFLNFRQVTQRKEEGKAGAR